MLKAVFIDYTGTTVQEGGVEMKEAIMRICKSSILHDPKEMMEIWWKTIKKFEEESYKETYLTEDEILDKALAVFIEKYQLEENIEELKDLVRGFWSNAPVFPDTKEFYDKCPLPLYVITNNGIQYVDKAMKKNSLSPTGIVCADEVKAYKPHIELFEKALEDAGCQSSEVIHIGDSYESDVIGARNADIKPILLQRNTDKEYDNELIIVKSLLDVLKLLEK